MAGDHPRTQHPHAISDRALRRPHGRPRAATATRQESDTAARAWAAGAQPAIPASRAARGTRKILRHNIPVFTGKEKKAPGPPPPAYVRARAGRHFHKGEDFASCALRGSPGWLAPRPRPTRGPRGRAPVYNTLGPGVIQNLHPPGA